MDNKKLTESINHCKEAIENLPCGKRKEEVQFLINCISDGRILSLPFKLSIKAYMIKCDTNKIIECEIVKVSSYESTIRLEIFVIDDNCYIHLDFNDIGKTVFLTREEAEKALKERSSDNDN